MRDVLSGLRCARGIDPIEQTNVDTAFVSQIINLQGFYGLVWVIAYGDITDGNVTFTTLMEEDTVVGFGSATAVADADMISQVAGTAPEIAASPLFGDDNEIRKIGYIGAQQFVRLTITPAGNNAGVIDVSAVAVMFPTASPAAVDV